MAITRIADIIEPTHFTNYVIQRTMEKSALLQSGIVENNAQFNALASEASSIIDMPYFNDLTGQSEVVTDTGAFTPDKIGTSADKARRHVRGKAWGANGLSALLSGADPFNAIADLTANFWVRDEQKMLLSTLKGVFASPSMANHVHDISSLTGGAELVSGSTFVDATQKLGDAKDQLTAVIMHSAVEAYLVKRQLVEYVNQTNEFGQDIRVPFFMGKRVIVDDAVPFNALVGEMYLFGSGAIALGNGSNPRIIQTEVSRDSLSHSGEDYLTNRRILMLHPRGIKWTETAVAGAFPTNAELETGTNWSMVYESKKIRIVKFKFKIE